MQIFVTNPNPCSSADFLWKNPVRARKMITESMQIMACALNHYGCNEQLKKANGEPYATPKNRMNHPVVKWVCEDKKHLAWLYWHCIYLYAEYDIRGGSKFNNVLANSKIILDFVGFDIIENVICDTKTQNQIKYLNFAKCKSKGLDFTHLPVCEAYQKYINIQEQK